MADLMCQGTVLPIWRVTAVDDDKILTFRADGRGRPAVGRDELAGNFWVKIRNLLWRPNRNSKMLGKLSRISGTGLFKRQVTTISAGRVFTPCLESATESHVSSSAFFFGGQTAWTANIICASASAVSRVIVFSRLK
jgi:hypothetical protein